MRKRYRNIPHDEVHTILKLRPGDIHKLGNTTCICVPYADRTGNCGCCAFYLDGINCYWKTDNVVYMNYCAITSNRLIPVETVVEDI